MAIKNLILIGTLFIAGCSSAPEEEFIYEEVPMVNEAQPQRVTNDKVVIDYIKSNKEKSAPKKDEAYAPRPQNSVFTLLGRNNKQVNRIYEESTKKIIIGQPEVAEEEQKTEEELILEAKQAEENRIRDAFTAECVTYCGNDYVYAGEGEKNDGEERICVRYPLECGEACTVDWHTQELIYDTNFTCKEAIQTKPEE